MGCERGSIWVFNLIFESFFECSILFMVVEYVLIVYGFFCVD